MSRQRSTVPPKSLAHITLEQPTKGALHNAELLYCVRMQLRSRFPGSLSRTPAAARALTWRISFQQRHQIRYYSCRHPAHVSDRSRTCD